MVNKYLQILPSHFRHFQFTKSLLEVTSADELMSCLWNYMDHLKPILIFYLIDSLNDPGLSEESQAYKRDWEYFQEVTSIKEIAGKFKGKDYPQGQSMRLQLQEDKLNKPVSYLYMLIDKVSGVICCFPRFQEAQISSLYVTIAIPSPLDPKVFQQQNVKDFLSSWEILSVYLDEDCVYKV